MDRREKALQKLRAKIKERHASLADDFEWVPRLLGRAAGRAVRAASGRGAVAVSS